MDETPILRTMSFVPTIKEYAGTVLAISEKSIRVLSISYSLLGGTMILVGFIFGDSLPLVYMVQLFGFYVFGFGILAKPLVKLTARIQFVGPDNVGLNALRHITIDRDGVHSVSQDGVSLSVRWEAVRKFRVIDKVAYLIVTKQMTLVIPERAFPDQSQWLSFLDVCSHEVVDSNVRKAVG